MRICFDVSPTGITSRGVRRRCISTHDVRRVHLFLDANGDAGVVVRKSLWHFVHVPAAALRDPELLAKMHTLVDAVRPTAKVDAAVDEFLGQLASDEGTAMVAAA